MAALTHAVGPTAYVSEVPGRFSPTYVVDKRSIATPATSTPVTSALSFLPRCEQADASFSTPTTVVQELGTNYHVGEFDDLPESKLKLSAYDVGYDVISLMTGKNAPASATTTYGFNDLATATVDIVRQFADPNGKIFASMYLGDMVLDELDISVKAKAAIMEDYSLTGFNMLAFRGFFVTKSYVVQAGDVTSNSITLSSIYGSIEAPVPMSVPSGSQPASYWLQRGSINFVKVEKYRAGSGFVRFPETAGTVAMGLCKYNIGSTVMSFFAGDLVAGDVVYFTYATWGTNVGSVATPGAPTLTPSGTGGTLPASTTNNYRIAAVTGSGNTLPGTEATAATTTGSTSSIVVTWTAVSNATGYKVYGRSTGAELLLATVGAVTTYTDTGAATPAGALPVTDTSGGAGYGLIPQLTVDTSDAVAVSTRLTPFTISANNIPRGSSLDIKIMMKRERAEGIGDVDGIWGPPDAPDVQVSLDVKMTDFGLLSVMMNGSVQGTDNGGTVDGDFFSPVDMTRRQLVAACPVTVIVNDPRSATAVLKTYTLPTVVFKTLDNSASTKATVTHKFSGSDRVGNFSIACVRP